MKYQNKYSKTFSKHPNYDFFRKSIDQLEVLIHRSLEMSPISWDEKRGIFYSSTEKTWISYFAQAATITNQNLITTSIENCIYDKNEQPQGRSDLLISYKEKSYSRDIQHILIEGKLSEWQAGKSWSIKKIAQESVQDAMEQAKGYARHIEPIPRTFVLYFDWYRDSNDENELEKANSFFERYDVDEMDIDFLINFEIKNSGIFIFGKAGN